MTAAVKTESSETGMNEKWPTTLAVIGAALRDWWDDWVNMVIINLLWWLCLLTVVLAAPATLAIYHTTHRLAYGQSVGPRGFLRGLRGYLWQGWLWFVAQLLALLLVGANYFFYGSLEARWAVYLQAFFVLLGLFWLLLQFYTLPYLMEQEEKSLQQAWRNALYTILAAPGYTLIIGSAAFLLAAVSVRGLAPLFLGGPCLLAQLGSRAVRERLETYGLRPDSGAAGPGETGQER